MTAGQGLRVFDGLDRCVWWHRLAMRLIASLALLGAAFASIAFYELVDVNALGCMAARYGAGVVAPPAAVVGTVAALPAAAGAPARTAGGASSAAGSSRRDE